MVMAFQYPSTGLLGCNTKNAFPWMCTCWPIFQYPSTGLLGCNTAIGFWTGFDKAVPFSTLLRVSLVVTHCSGRWMAPPAFAFSTLLRVSLVVTRDVPRRHYAYLTFSTLLRVSLVVTHVETEPKAQLKLPFSTLLRVSLVVTKRGYMGYLSGAYGLSVPFYGSPWL